MTESSAAEVIVVSKAVEVFAAELAKIATDEIRVFTTLVLDRIDPRFYEISASSSGMHHAGQQHGPGGLVRHTRAAFFMADRLTRSYELEPVDADLARAGALLHDIGKPYEQKNGGDSTLKHDAIGATLVEELGKEVKAPCAAVLANIVGLHMSAWGAVPTTPDRMPAIAQIVAVADYTVSQKGLTFTDIDKINDDGPGQ